MAEDLPTIGELNSYFQRSPFNEWMDLGVESVEPGRSVVTVPYDERLTNPGGVVHGGILASLMDVTAAATLLTERENPAEPSLATTDMSIRYLRPASGELRAVGRIERAGSSLGVAAVDVESATEEDGRKKVATGSVSYKFL